MKSRQLARSHVPCAARFVCWRAVLLEDEPDGQLMIALKE